jgi:hypothetical protein
MSPPVLGTSQKVLGTTSGFRIRPLTWADERRKVSLVRKHTPTGNGGTEIPNRRSGVGSGGSQGPAGPVIAAGSSDTTRRDYPGSVRGGGPEEQGGLSIRLLGIVARLGSYILLRRSITLPLER